MAGVFLDIEKAFYTAWHSGLPYKLSELNFSTSLTDWNFEVLVEGEFSTPRKIVAGVLQGSIIAPVLHRLHINDASAASGTHHALFVRRRYLYLHDRETRTSCSLQLQLQWGLTAVNLWCEHGNIKINEGKTQAICISRSLRVPDEVLQLNGWDIPFVNNVKCLGSTLDRRMT
jgi:hypothetical protein